MTTARKKEWDELTSQEQKPYLEKAEYLIERGYPSTGKNIYILAKIIYNKSDEN